MSIRESIKIRNNLLYYAKLSYDNSIEYLNDKGEHHTFEPLFTPEQKIIQVKVFYGTRDEGVLRGYHGLCEEALKKFLKEYKEKDK